MTKRDDKIFSTHTLPPDTTVTAWRDYLSEVYFMLDVIPDSYDFIQGRLQKRSLDSINISRLSATKQSMLRTRQAAKLDKIDTLVLISPLSGRFDFTQRSIERIAQPGDAFMLSSSEHHAVTISNDAHMTCLEIPRALISERIPKIDNLGAAHLFSDHLIMNLLRDVGRRILQYRTSIEPVLLEKICLDITEVAISAGHDDRRNSSILDNANFIQILDVISRKMADCNFCLADCAAVCGISKRHLQSILHSRGTTFSRELMSARLSQAKKMITHLRSGLGIAQIATLCGFSSQAYFATVYRKRFGISPRDERHGR